MALDILLTILYRVWIRVKVLPHKEYEQIFLGESKMKQYYLTNL